MEVITLSQVRELAEDAFGHIDKIYLHWTAGAYSDYSYHYHLNIDYDGSIILTCDDLTELKSHTWRRNSRSVAISMCCCFDAMAYAGGYVDFGSNPPTPEQIDSCSQVVSVLCKYLNIPIDYLSVMTHCEAAELDGYGPSTTCERWDLWKLYDLPGSGELIDGGDVIRGKAIWWQNNLFV